MDALVRKHLEETPLNEMGEEFGILARRVREHKAVNRGRVPREIFIPCLGIAGLYYCVEVVVEVLDGQKHMGYALKRRGAPGEQGWEGQYQIVGITIVEGDTPGKIFERLSEEMFGPYFQYVQPHNVSLLGTEFHFEPERGVDCVTTVFLWQVRWDLYRAMFRAPEWCIFAQTNESVIEHHRNTLAWADDTFRPLIADLRDGYKPRGATV